jgi:hypothetical protein
MKMLNISTPVVLESELGINATSTDRIISICRKVGASVYFSGAGGKDYIDESRFAAAGIELVYQHYSHPVYPQVYDPFIPYMSAIDLLFNCGLDSLKILKGDSNTS